MGITGLLPFLEKSSRKCNVSEFSGHTVAIDSYCWLHKGAFSCGDKIVMGQTTDAYVKYCMKFVNMLLSHNIKPILVFDGRHLPAKAETEVKRRESREVNRKRAAELIKMGNTYEGKNLLRRSLDVSHHMALDVIKQCQAQNVDCIVAPYEADAQLAYLNISGIADLVITEDSDLTLFGCKKILFKMDLYGHGVLIEQERLHLAMGLQPSNFNIEKFRHMCILSGCDYLASLPGIGLGKAHKFILKNTDENIYNALLRLSSTLNMKSLIVTKEYRDGFMRALITFKHQLVFCPIRRCQVRLNSPTPDVTPEQLEHAGSEVEAELALQLALGNCDPFTFKKLHNFDPDCPRPRRTNNWSTTAVAKHKSIWSKDIEIKEKKSSTPKESNHLPVKLSSTRGQIVLMKTDTLKKEITPRKRTFEDLDMSVDDLIDLYKQDAKSAVTVIEPEVLSSDEPTSPILIKRSNPFRKKCDTDETSPSLLQKVRKRLPIKSRIRATVIDETAIPHSKFFAAESNIESKSAEAMDVSMINNVSIEESKENIHTPEQRVIIPESEAFDNDSSIEVDLKKDSGYQGSMVEKEMNTSAMSLDNSVAEKEPLHLVNSNLAKITEDIEIDVPNNVINDRDDIEFSITREVFTECRSSMFMYETPTPDKRQRRSFSLSQSSQSSQKSSQAMQGSSTRRTVRTKKTSIIQGQQSLNMFGFQKKNSLKH